MHRISSSIIEHGVARLVFNEKLHTLKGILINDEDESFSFSGSLAPSQENSTEQKMRIIIVDDETGEKFCVEDVVVKLVHADPNSLSTAATAHPKIEIETSTIKFKTEEILIGNRADVEIRRYLDPTDPLMRSNGEKSPEERRVVHVGKMQLRLVVSQKRTLTPPRRSSISQPDVEWVQNDFLV